jgi:hypothetical protein
MDLVDTGCDETYWESYPVARFGISGTEISGSDTMVLYFVATV